MLGIPIRNRHVTTIGETFYTNTVENVLILRDAEKIILSSNPDGTGNIVVDDKVVISFTDKDGTTITYSKTYNRADCSGFDAQTPENIKTS